jgi:hypothetical protein
MCNWMSLISPKGDIIDKSIASYAISIKKSKM